MISAKDQIISGIKAYGKAFQVISANKMGKHFVWPVVFNIVLVILIIWSGFGISDWIKDLIESSADKSNGWIKTAIFAIKIIMPIVCFILFIFIGGTIVNLLMSPIYTKLSELTDTYITGRTFQTDAKQTMKDIWRTVVISITNIFKQLFFTLLCLLLNIIPVIGSIASVVMIFLINAYYFGYGFMDYTNERARRSPKVSNKVTSRYKYLAITNGAIYALPLYCFCGTFIAAFLGGVSTIAATISQLELESQDTELQSITHE